MYPELSSHIQQSEDYQGYQQRLESDMPAIKQGDNYDTSNIIHHSQGGQEDTHAQRHPLPQQAQYGQGESDIRSHRNSRPVYLGRRITY